MVIWILFFAVVDPTSFISCNIYFLSPVNGGREAWPRQLPEKVEVGFYVARGVILHNRRNPSLSNPIIHAKAYMKACGDLAKERRLSTCSKECQAEKEKKEYGLTPGRKSEPSYSGLSHGAHACDVRRRKNRHQRFICPLLRARFC